MQGILINFGDIFLNYCNFYTLIFPLYTEFTYEVNLRGVRVTTVAVGNNKYYIY